MAINLKSAFFGTQIAAKQMIKQGGGRIINVTSVHEDWPMPGNTAYCLSKGGMRMLTRTAGARRRRRAGAVPAWAPQRGWSSHRRLGARRNSRKIWNLQHCCGRIRGNAPVVLRRSCCRNGFPPKPRPCSLGTASDHRNRDRSTRREPVEANMPAPQGQSRPGPWRVRLPARSGARWCETQLVGISLAETQPGFVADVEQPRRV